MGNEIDIKGLRAALESYRGSLWQITDYGNVIDVYDGSDLAEWAEKTLACFETD